MLWPWSGSAYSSIRLIFYPHPNLCRCIQKNLADPAACQAGKDRRLAAGGPGNQQPPDSESSAPVPTYRDRAAERRQVFHQPAIPLPEDGNRNPANKRKFAKAPTPPPPRPEPGPAPGEDESNVGNQLLKKMGWTEGTGLGLEGQGRQAPIETLLFAEKAGIGASKGKDTTKYQGFDGYAKYAKDSVGLHFSHLFPFDVCWSRLRMWYGRWLMHSVPLKFGHRKGSRSVQTGSVIC